MEQVTKTNGMVIKSYGVNKYEHDIGVKLIVNNNFGSILSGGYFFTKPDSYMINSWIVQGEENAEFLSDALKNNATIYTMWETIVNDTAQPLGDFAVFDDE